MYKFNSSYNVVLYLCQLQEVKELDLTVTNKQPTS